mmetsp:Transcript_107340/g.256382  ORF Transcript_107340/g.256382 Transcript_107340/m.256382 type:complete len:219 (-) Transcript_107340:863-1519(-)
MERRGDAILIPALPFLHAIPGHPHAMIGVEVVSVPVTASNEDIPQGGPHPRPYQVHGVLQHVPLVQIESAQHLLQQLMLWDVANLCVALGILKAQLVILCVFRRPARCLLAPGKDDAAQLHGLLAFCLRAKDPAPHVDVHSAALLLTLAPRVEGEPLVRPVAWGQLCQGLLGVARPRGPLQGALQHHDAILLEAGGARRRSGCAFEAIGAAVLLRGSS